MAQRNPQQIAAKWARNLGAATQTIKDGVLAVTQNPAEKAAQRESAYVAGVQRAVASGKWQRGLRKVTLQSWQDSMIQKGLPRIMDGANRAQQKFMDFMVRWLQYLDGLKPILAQMPRGDLQQNIQRMIRTVEYAANYRAAAGG